MTMISTKMSNENHSVILFCDEGSFLTHSIRSLRMLSLRLWEVNDVDRKTCSSIYTFAQFLLGVETFVLSQFEAAYYSVITHQNNQIQAGVCEPTHSSFPYVVSARLAPAKNLHARLSARVRSVFFSYKTNTYIHELNIQFGYCKF